MRIKLLLLLLLANLFAKAQTPYHSFPEDSAQWSYWESGIDSISGQPYTHSFQLKMIGDTMINGMAYNKIYKSADIAYPSISDSLHCFIRQDTAQRKVVVCYPLHLYNDSSENLLYDFGLQVGDTFNIKLITDGTLHEAVIIASTDSVQTNVDYRREFFLQFIEWDIWGPSCDVGCQWLEGIGNYCNPLYIEIPDSFCWDHYYNVQCFWHNGQYVAGGTFCDFNTGINEDFIGKENQLLIYPNPISNISTIDLFHN